jgi:hypothetical protein
LTKDEVVSFSWMLLLKDPRLAYETYLGLFLDMKRVLYLKKRIGEWVELEVAVAWATSNPGVSSASSPLSLHRI